MCAGRRPAVAARDLRVGEPGVEIRGGHAQPPTPSGLCCAPMQTELSDLVARALAEDVGTGDVTSAATVPETARAVATITQKAPGVIFGLDAAEAVFRSLDPDAEIERLGPEGEWRESGPVLAGRGQRPRAAGGRAHRAEHPGPAVGCRDAHREVCTCDRGHRSTGPRHAQDDPGPAGAREGRRRGRRRAQPPLRPVGRDPHQGEPRGDGRRRRPGRPRGPRDVPRPPAGGRVPQHGRDRRGARGGRPAHPARQHGSGASAHRGRAGRRAARCWRRAAG